MRQELQIGLSPNTPGFHLDILHTCQVETLWELLEPMYAESVKYAGGMLSIGELKALLYEGRATAVLLLENDRIRAAFAVCIMQYSEYSACQIIAAAGKNMSEAFARMDVVGAWAISQGATSLEGWCRPGMVRLWRKVSKGRAQPKTTLVSCDLTRMLQ